MSGLWLTYDNSHLAGQVHSNEPTIVMAIDVNFARFLQNYQLVGVQPTDAQATTKGLEIIPKYLPRDQQL